MRLIVWAKYKCLYCGRGIPYDTGICSKCNSKP